MEFLYLFLLTFLPYFVFSVGGFFLCHKLIKNKIKDRFIFSNKTKKKQLMFEFKNSMSSLVIGFLGFYVLYLLNQSDLTFSYSGVDKYGYVYFVLSFFIVQFCHEVYFYFTHKLMHTKALFKYHAIHHKSIKPTPLASYSFHPVEASVHALFFVLAGVLLPVHELMVPLFYVFSHYINMWGHMGVEFWIDNIDDRKVWKELNTPTHHFQHHLNPDSNFSIYYNTLDRIYGTNNPNYNDFYNGIKSKVKSKIFGVF